MTGMAVDPRAPKSAPNKDGVAGEGGEAGSTSRVAWVMGWVVGPGLLVASIWIGGVYVGANLPESWPTRLVNWLVH